MSVQDDWLAFRAGRAEFDKSRFLTLFHDDPDAAALDAALPAIFDGLPAATALVHRTRRILSARRALREGTHPRLPDETLLALAGAEMRARLPVIEAMGEAELAGLAAAARPRMEPDREGFEAARRADWPEGEMHCTLGDHALDRAPFAAPVDWALWEAFYGVANSPAIQRFLAAPLLDGVPEGEAYVALWEAGADMALTEDGILVHRTWEG